jgi:hypothetical protein
MRARFRHLEVCMVLTDRNSRTERVKWLLGRYPDITPEEVREITAFLKRSPALDIALFELNGEVKPVLGRFERDRRRDCESAPRDVAIAVALLVLLLLGIVRSLGDFDIPR